jgi:hypothetical protein
LTAKVFQFGNAIFQYLDGALLGLSGEEGRFAFGLISSTPIADRRMRDVILTTQSAQILLIADQLTNNM